MVDRFVIKPFSNGMGLRITKPGVDASNESSPFIISSDFDYLKQHASGTIRMNSRNQGGYTTYWNNITYPDLGYIPLVFYSTQIYHSQSETRIVYPCDRNSSGIEGTWVNVTESKCLVTSSGLWFYSKGPNVEFTVDIRYIVFKHRMIN